MTLSADGHPFGVSHRVAYLSLSSTARSAASASKAKVLRGPAKWK